ERRTAREQRIWSKTGLAQGHERQEARDADKDAATFHDSGRDEAQRATFALSLDHGEQRDGGADAGEGHDDLEDATEEDASVRARADDEARIVHPSVESEGRKRAKGEQAERARHER